MPIRIPATADEVSREWLSEMLEADIADYSLTPIGDGAGYASSVMRVRLISRNDVPDSIILKLAASTREKRELALSYFSYRKESYFYRRLGGTIPVRTPYCYFNLLSDDHSSMALGLEDLAGHRFVNQGLGAGRDQALTAVRCIARLHAHCWNASDHNIPDFRTTFEIAAGDLEAMIPATLARFPQPGFVQKFLDHYAHHSATYVERFVTKPQVLSHIDYRLDNLCFTQNSSDVILFDWGDVAFAPPGFDLAYFLVTSCAPETRRSIEDEAISLYHRTLDRSDFSVDQCADSYRLCMPATFYFPALMTTAGGDMDHAAVMVDRGASAIADHLDWLDELFS